MAAGLQGVVSRGERIARRRGQPTRSTHLLLALLHHAQVRALLSSHGVQEGHLLEAVAGDLDEPVNAIPLVLERAQRLAEGEVAAGALHLLIALLRERRTCAAQWLSRLAPASSTLEREAFAALGCLPPAAPPERRTRAKTRRAAVHAAQEVRHDVRQDVRHDVRQMGASGQSRSSERLRLRRSAAALGLQQRLAEQTEQGKRARKHCAGDARPSPPPAQLPEPPIARADHQPVQQLTASRAVVPEPATGTLDPERFPLLTSLGRDLTAAAAEGRIDPVVGRDEETEQLLDVLSRRRANNPVLVGPPGVGKTAIVEGLARALHEGRSGLGDRVLIELSASALISGTGVRGALSERLQALIEEVSRGAGRILLFIDEIHGLIGSDESADSLANGLKAALARGELSCIGATTDAEYRRVFERDAALSRRFTPIVVQEPTPPVAASIVAGAAPEYEKHHGVAYAPEALSAAIELSVRFLPERRLPDKAIALIDQAAARVRRRGGAVVGRESVAEVVSELCGVPLARLLMSDGDALLALESALGRRIVGQPRAIVAIANALRKSAAGFRGARPLGTFLLLGPTGVGKTEMAKAISELLFPGSEMTRFDMSELSEAHAVARLLGAPPGYVGHEEGGQLTEAVRKRPYQLILLDEIEKAHREVLLTLLPLLDEGRLTDARGRGVDFQNTVIVMTSNLGAQPNTARARIGFGAPQQEDEEALADAALAAARGVLPLELWNRIDEPLYFRPLSRADAACIARRLVQDAAQVLCGQYGVHVSVEDSAIEALIDAGGYDPQLGARPMRRTVGRLVEAPLARAVLSGRLREGEHVTLRGEDGRVAFQ